MPHLHDRKAEPPKRIMKRKKSLKDSLKPVSIRTENGYESDSSLSDYEPEMKAKVPLPIRNYMATHDLQMGKGYKGGIRLGSGQVISTR